MDFFFFFLEFNIEPISINDFMVKKEIPPPDISNFMSKQPYYYRTYHIFKKNVYILNQHRFVKRRI